MSFRPLKYLNYLDLRILGKKFARHYKYNFLDEYKFFFLELYKTGLSNPSNIFLSILR